MAHPGHVPSDKVVVFDEAQRAWDAEYGAQKFNRAKSEPALFLEIMERHPDWAVIIALVGGGQEINRGERGLTEWGIALNERRNSSTSGPQWHAIAAPDVVTGGDATAWQSLFPGGASPDWLARDERLHLPTSVRSYRCLATTQWVNCLLEGRILDARQIAERTDDFPIYLRRSLATAAIGCLRAHEANDVADWSQALALAACGPMVWELCFPQMNLVMWPTGTFCPEATFAAHMRSRLRPTNTHAKASNSTTLVCAGTETCSGMRPERGSLIS